MHNDQDRQSLDIDTELDQLEQDTPGQLLQSARHVMAPRPEFVQQLRTRLVTQKEQAYPSFAQKVIRRMPHLMNTRVFRIASAALAVVLIVATALIWLAPSQEVDAAQILDRAAQSTNNLSAGGLQSYHATRMVHYPSKNGSGSSEVREEIWGQLPNQLRIEQYSAGSQEPALIQIGDGTRVWLYEPGKKQVEILPKPLGKDQTIAAGDLQDLLNQVSKDHIFDARLSSTTNIAGREAYVIDLTPTQNAAKKNPHMSLARWFIDRQTYLPLGQEVYDESGKLTTGWRYSSLQINPAINTGMFTFTPPPGVQVIEQPLDKKSTPKQDTPASK